MFVEWHDSRTYYKSLARPELPGSPWVIPGMVAGRPMLRGAACTPRIEPYTAKQIHLYNVSWMTCCLEIVYPGDFSCQTVAGSRDGGAVK